MSDESAQSEWRHGWYFGAFARWSWTDIALWPVIELTLHPRKEWGAWFHAGPFSAYAGWEEEDRLFINGVDQECAIAPVDGYAPTPEAPRE